MANIATLTSIAEVMYDINASGIDETQTLEVVGPPGCAKTAWARQLVDHLSATKGTEFGLSVRHLSVEDPLDGPGVLHIGDTTDDIVFGVNVVKDAKRAERTYPGLFPQPWEFEGGVIPEHGVLVLDEYGQSDNDQKKATATLIDERRLGKFRLPVGWMVVLTSNRVQDRAGVAKPLTFITTRKTVVEMEYNSELHVHWLESKNVHFKLRAFVQANPSIVQVDSVPDHDNPYSTCRTFYRACMQLMGFGVIDAIGTDEQMTPRSRLAREVVIGTIGEGAAARLFGHLRYCESMVKMEDIIKNPQTAQIPDRPDVMWAVVQMLASFAKEQAQAGSNGKDLMPAFTYMKRMPENFQMSCVRMMAKSNKKLLMDARYASWVRENRELIMAAVASETQARGQ